MQSSKFKGILLFLIVFCVFAFLPKNVEALTGPGYSFGFNAYICEGDPTYTTIDTCRTKFYNNELMALDPNAQVAPGTTILLGLTYDHNYMEWDDETSPYYYMNAANTLNMVVNYNDSVLEPIDYSYKVGKTTYAYTGVVPANSPLNTAYMDGTEPTSDMNGWTYSANITGGVAALVVGNEGTYASLSYNPGTFVFIAFHVKDNASGTFDFSYDTTSNQPTSLSAHDTSVDVNFEATDTLSLKVAGEELSNDDTISTLTAKGYTASTNYNFPVYVDNNYTTAFSAGLTNKDYYMVVPSSVTSVKINSKATDSNAKFTLTQTDEYEETFQLNNTTLVSGSTQLYKLTFLLHAENTSTEVETATYNVYVYKLSADATLQRLTSSNTNVVINSFASNTYTYNISSNYNINNNTHTNSNSTITAKPTHANAFVTNPDDSNWTTSSGNYTSTFLMPNYGSTVNTKVVKVQAEDCLAKYASVPGNESCHTQDYTLNVTRANPSSDATLKALAVDGTSIFVTGKTDYDQGIQRYSKSSVSLTATANDSKATVVSSTLGTKNLNVGWTTLTVTVQAENCKTIQGSSPQPTCTTQDYTIKFYRNSNNANLNTLVVSGIDLNMSPAFTDHGYVGPYTVSYPSGTTSVNVSATTEEPHAAMNITGLADGITYSDLDNQLSIIVTAEDGNTKTYVIRFSRILSTESRLSGLTVSGVALSPNPFDPDTYSYTGAVDGNVDSVTVNASLYDPDKSEFMDGYGPRTVPLSYGPNVFYVRVQGEADDATSSYNITITRNEKTIKTLDEITIDGVAIYPYDKDTHTYALNAVPYATTSVTIGATVTDADSTYSVLNQSMGVAAGGVINLATGDNTVTVRVWAQDGSYGDYILNIPRTKNNDASINNVSFFGQNATCNSETKKCTITLANQYGTLTKDDVVVTTNDTNARVTKPESTIELRVDTPSSPKTNSYIFSVTAENGTTTQEYEVTITRQANSDNSLKEVTVLTDGGQTLRCSTFTDFACTISVPSTTTSYILTGVANTPATTIVDGGGTYTMNGATESSQLRTLTVTAQNEISQTYQIRIERGKSTNANLATITIDGTEIPDFDGVNTQIYSVTVPGTTETITLGAVVDDVGKATIENESTVLGGKTLSYGNNVYTIKVIAEAGGSAVKTYTLTVTRSNNIDSSLSMIKIGGTNLDGFNTETTLYDYDSNYYKSLGTSNPLSVPYTQTSVTLEGTPTDTVYGTVKYNNGNNKTIELHTGLNEITITGIAHDTSITTDYVLKIYRALNTSNSIAKLEVAGVEAVWDDTNSKYTVTVPNSVDSVGPLNVNVTLPATQLATDPKATINTPTMALKTDDATNGNVNNYQITVTSESGDARTYNVEITREKSSINTLKALTITNGSFSPSFLPSENLVDGDNTNVYNVIVPADTTQFTVTYVKDNDKSSVAINTGANVTMDTSTKQVVITVTAENGDVNTYTLNVERIESVLTTLSSITINSGSVVYPLNETFSPDKTSYSVTLPGTVSQINISASVSDDRSHIKSGTGVHDVELGEQTFSIRVEGENPDAFLDYFIKVTVLPKTVATLSSLEVNIPQADTTTINLPLSPTFDESTLNYTLSDQPYDVSKINIIATVADEDATLKINGVSVNSGAISQQTLEVGNNVIPVTVTAQDGTTIGNYKINVKRAGNNDPRLSNLNISGGTLSPTFDPDEEDYTVTLSATTNSLDPNAVTATAVDSNATVSKGGEVVITGNPDDDVFTIDVTAQDGVTTKQYRVKVIRRLSSDATLKDLELSGATLTGTFLPTNHNYEINIPSTSTSFEITGIANSDRAKSVEGNGVYPADSTETVTITVTAEDGTKGVYNFRVYTASSHDTSLTNLRVVGYTLNPEFTTTTLTYDVGEVNLGTTSLNVIATPTNPDATVYYYIGAQTPSTSNIVTLPQAIGDYTVTVKVVPATGIDANAKYYFVNYQMVKSGNNDLSLLIPSTGALTPSFSKTVSSYRISVPYDATSVSFQVKTDDPSASVSKDNATYDFTNPENKVFTFDNLTVGTNAKTIYVKAANGDIKEYSITITRNNRVASDDVYLSGLSVDSFDYLEKTYTPTLSPEFNKNTEAYSIGAIPFGQETLTVRPSKNYAAQTIAYELNGSSDKVSINADGSGTIMVKDKIGSNVIGIIVTAENGETKTYQITYTRTPSTNVYLESLVDSLGKISGFNKTKIAYEIDVDATVSTLRMTLTTEDKTSTISINGEERTHQWVYTTPTLAGGTNTVTVIVKAENGDTKTYTITINKEGASELITSRVFGHKIEDGMIKSAILNESLSDLKDQLDNDNTKLQIWNANETAEITDLTTKVATGQIVKLVNLSTGAELDRKVVVVLGDTDGNGKITLFDSVKIVNHYLDKSALEGPYLVAADVDKNTKITLFDSVKIVNHYLDKSYINYSV